MNAFSEFRILQESHEAILRSFLRVDPDFWPQVAGAHSLLRLRDVGGACGTVPFRNLAVNIRKSPRRSVNHVSTLVGWLVISEFRRSFIMCVLLVYVLEKRQGLDPVKGQCWGLTRPCLSKAIVSWRGGQDSHMKWCSFSPWSSSLNLYKYQNKSPKHLPIQAEIVHIWEIKVWFENLQRIFGTNSFLGGIIGWSGWSLGMIYWRIICPRYFPKKWSEPLGV